MSKATRQGELSLQKRTLADLARSGLDADAARKMRVKPLDANAVSRLTEKYSVPAYEIPYFELTGKPNCFSRLRFLAPTRGFAARKDQRYWQPAGSPIKAYLPPFADWVAIAADPEVEIYITEGEKKAAAATLAGFPTIGLGGVWSWRSKKRCQSFLPDLLEVNWKNRRTTLVFDADPEPKPEVNAALRALARELTQRGSMVTTVALPTTPGLKMGLDDYLVDHGAEDFRNLPREEMDIGLELSRLNDEIAYIENIGAVYAFDTDQFYKSKQQFSGIAYADRIAEVLDARGNLKKINVADEWLRWQNRKRFSRLAYEPGQPKTLPDGSYNFWSGWGAEPVAGNVAPFLDLIDYLFAGADPAHKTWFLQWLAYPIQYPGTKLYSAVVLWSQHQGVGKTLLGQTVGQVYGTNYAVVTQKQLHSAFNDWARNKQFVLGEEVTGTDKRQDADILKHLITSETISINQKYKPEQEQKNLANYMFTSNQPDSFLLDASDRRYFIHEITATPPAMEFFNAYDVWLRHPDAAAAVFHHLLRAVDCRGFNPRATAPVTESKRDMIELSGGELDSIARQLWDNPDNLLQFAGRSIDRDLFTTSELATLIATDIEIPFSRIALSRALRRVGFRRLPATRIDASQTRTLWAIRNQDKWLAETHKARVSNYQQTRQQKY